MSIEYNSKNEQYVTDLIGLIDELNRFYYKVFKVITDFEDRRCINNQIDIIRNTLETWVGQEYWRHGSDKNSWRIR